MIEYVNVSPESGSLELNEPMTVPTGLFSGTVVCVKSIFVGASLVAATEIRTGTGVVEDKVPSKACMVKALSVPF
jgi:hypothetical protein